MKILFQGDSITDVGRNCNNGSRASIGQGYALMVSGDLGAKYPGKYEFLNLGISGNRVVDLYARIKADMWNHEPDLISILIGVNDVWHEQYGNGVETERFEAVYRMLIEDTKKRLPGVRFMLLEPFFLPGSATTDTEENEKLFSVGVAERAAVVRKLAEECGATFVPLQKRFDDACRLAPADYWLADGVHPTPAGHRIIADAWIEAFKGSGL